MWKKFEKIEKFLFFLSAYYYSAIWDCTTDYNLLFNKKLTCFCEILNPKQIQNYNDKNSKHSMNRKARFCFEN